MTLNALTDRKSVLAAIAEFESLGRSNFLKKYGFRESRTYFLLHENTRYDSKAIAGAAYGYQYPFEGPLAAEEFSGGEQTVVKKMEDLGFEIERIKIRNPAWTEDELILALDLYLRRGLLGDKDPELVELSNLLRSLPIYPLSERTSNFRNPNGVSRKLSNFSNHDPSYTGKPTKGNHLDGKVYETWIHRRSELKEVVEAIKISQAGNHLTQVPEPDEDEIEAPEGRLLYRRHRTRERSQKLKKKKIDAVIRSGKKIACEICDFNFAYFYGERGEGYIECHHIKPLHESGETKTQLKDLALVCSNCHRIIHRKHPWPTPSELKNAIGKTEL